MLVLRGLSDENDLGGLNGLKFINENNSHFRENEKKTVRFKKKPA